jgi:hypothetical protein
MATDERIARHTADEIDEMLRRGEDRTDFARIDALTEEELEASIDIEEEGEIDWSTLQVGIPGLKRQLTLRSMRTSSTGSRPEGADIRPG